ncbi:glycosyltransferase family 2 protein [Capnocytophaga gingivalis]|jgi:chitin synthase|uniref:glycosyltransferase family 2 protein n=1 Tax=Capnocytophaga gingivalis TaxID=1017 RepID=UPI0023F4607B|nr:glycosyltransferase [Capnocytophaga gingivalis]
MELLYDIFQVSVLIYSIMILLCIGAQVLMARQNLRNNKWKYTDLDLTTLKNSPLAPGISIVAPAYNEQTTIISNVNSLLSLDYPKYEVVIVNDGSKDRTLELLIEEYELEETPFMYIERIKASPVKRIFKSKNPKYAKLTVVDKVNGGTKADASNAGVNACRYPYMLNTDVDCVLAKDALLRMIMPFLKSSVRVIGVGATLRMSNGCEMEDGKLVRVSPPKSFFPAFQEIEYLRSYLVGKMGWSVINGVPNISGGLGLFDKEILINAGGYDPASFAEDMDMVTRMIVYMRDFNYDYRIVEIPDTCCWTEGPPNYSVMYKQRTRWARGLFQFFMLYRKYLWNYKYGRLGLVTMPYMFLFEFLAPLIEIVGWGMLIYLLVIGKINHTNALLIFGTIYLFGLMVSSSAIVFDYVTKQHYKRLREYFRLFAITLIEPFTYHLLIVYFSIRGYISFLSKKNFEWGEMTRKGIDKKKQQPVAVQN